MRQTDVGASQLIIDGKIKLKNDGQISEFTETGLKFENGGEMPVDVVVFATGLGDARDGVRKVCGDAVGDKCKKIWALNEEGVINGAWHDLGVPGLWYMIGACFALVMFFSFSSVIRHSDPGHYWETSCSAASISSTSRFVRLPFFPFLSISSQFIPIGVEIKAMEEGIFGERYSTAD
ncbi:hypothetical protein B0H14DRAFT_3011265 [Mycena olivaceomarginata]|nr:hypothetical protein B0H14DRAFT_3011265 [Mycena olivaceomarginata]